MSAHADFESAIARQRMTAHSESAVSKPMLLVYVAVVLFGLLGFSEQLRALWITWNTDALRSVGMLVPPLSALLLLRHWRDAGWRMPRDGSWWGLALMTACLTLAVATGLAHYGFSALLEIAPGQMVLLSMHPPFGLLLFGYFSGAVILLGGVSTWKALWFPLTLWLLANPVPRAFQVLVDLPSQALGARVARSFARLIDVPFEGDALKLMFTPELGIFIAPGCNGMRGAVTMGFIALLIGHFRKLSWPRWTTLVVVAVALAYVLNLVRLCAVIIYYWLALRVPVLGRYGTEIDYVIGGSIFFAAVYFLVTITQPRQAA